jgi:two-component system, OmpR family, response regulator
VTGRPFSDGKRFRTEAEADLHGIAFGQLIIDGQIPWFSVD